MTMLRMITLCAAMLSLAGAAIAGDAPKRPAWCQPGYVCVPTSEIAEDAEYHLDLREQIAHYRGRSSRFGLSIGFGLGVGGVVDRDFQVQMYLPTGVFLIYGLRF